MEQEVLSKQHREQFLNDLNLPSLSRSEVRMNNRAERCDRVLRYLEKVRYKWRRRVTIVRHILMQFENWMNRKKNESTMTA